MSLANPSTHTDAVIALLRAAGLVVGDAAPPGEQFGHQASRGGTFISYCIVYPLNQTHDGPLGCPDSQSEFSWQVTCVGDSRSACESVMFTVDQTLIGHPLTVSGRSVLRVRAATDGARQVRIDQTNPARPVLIATPRYSAFSS